MAGRPALHMPASAVEWADAIPEADVLVAPPARVSAARTTFEPSPTTRMSRLALSLALALVAPSLAAQPLDPDVAPRQGTIRGGNGALDLEISAPDEHPDADCVGFLDRSAPDATVDWSGSGPMRLWVRSSADATMTIIGPDGEMRCVDDEDGVQPALLYEQPARGRYAVWVGAFGWDEAQDAAATLYVGPPTSPVSLGDVTGAPALTFDGGDDASIDVAPGGLYPARALGMPDYCTGFYHAEPSARVSGPAPYSITATSDADLTLAVRTRGGGWICNDDASPFDNAPGLEIQGEGEQIVWVGTFRGYARTETPEATLTVTAETIIEPEFDFDPGERERFSEASYTVLDLDARGPILTLGANADSTDATYSIGETVANPVTGDLCRGNISLGRTLTVRAEGDGPFTLYATGDDDLVLVARDADGQWFCSDDAAGRDPAIEIAEAGDVAVWIGTFGQIDGASASFSIMRGALDDLLPDDVDMDFDEIIDEPFASWSTGMYDGDEVGGDAQTTVRLADGSAEAQIFAGGDLFMPVEGDACTGYITSEPTASVDSQAEMVSFAASAMEDLTLLVRAPDGQWFCSDDYDGRDPGIEVSGAGDGTYSIWVGTFNVLDVPVEAVLTIEEGALPE